MGKRAPQPATTIDSHHLHPITPAATATRSIRKRKRNPPSEAKELESALVAPCPKTLRMSTSAHNNWQHYNDDEDSSSNDTPLPSVPLTHRNYTTKQANNSSILLNSSSLNNSLGGGGDYNCSSTESPKPVYTLRPSLVNGTILHDLTQKPWRLGRPIGKGNFGEIFLASDNISIPVINENAKYVVKIEPHSNGPLFVEIHCLMNTAKKNNAIKEDCKGSVNINKPSGIPDYIASGSHYFGSARYRFLVLPRFDRDLHSLIKNCRVQQKSVLTLAIQIVNVLEKLHDSGYCHNDVKAQNLMISKCKYLKQQKQEEGQTAINDSKFSNDQHLKMKSSKYKEENFDEKQQTTDSGNSSEQEANDEEDEDFVLNRRTSNNNKKMKKDYDNEEEDEDFDDGATTNSAQSISLDMYSTPINRNRTHRVTARTTTAAHKVEYSGSNPVRSCRRQKRNSIYDEMVTSHYLRPSKRISYSEFFSEDGSSVNSGSVERSPAHVNSNSSDEDFEECLPLSLRPRIVSDRKSYGTNTSSYRRLTKRQEKLLSAKEKHNLMVKEKMERDIKYTKNGSASLAQYKRPESWIEFEEERIFLIDFGLASKYTDNGVHRPFIMDQRRAHDGTLEFTSRDAHMGAHSRRSDMECLGYNLLYWSQGYLPWKDAASNQQQEKVHRAKEYLMTDVRELLRQIYGKHIPSYLGEFLHLVSQLSYQERPDYGRYKRLFEKEFKQLGYSVADMRLSMQDIQRTCVRIKDKMEQKMDSFEIGGQQPAILNTVQNFNSGIVTPYHERTATNRVSPKNLRSKSDKKTMKKKTFSWTEILSQDPDQIARERADREFDREEELSEEQQPALKRYHGKPTYAILKIIKRLRENGRAVDNFEPQTTPDNNALMMETAVGHEYDIEQSAKKNDDEEADGTDISDSISAKRAKQQERNSISRKSSKKKLILKTSENVEAVLTASCSTLVKSRTRRKKAAQLPLRYSPSIEVKSTGKIKKRRRKPKSLCVVNHASISGELKGSTEKHSADTKREYRARRCLIKGTSAPDLSEDDSNSNFSTENRTILNAWKKISNEPVHLRNFKK
uniref:non-specific serine/threonine protein kinase n=1 Tax=Glossina pallidipes TaxID=7398 RepID=A0A1A9Z5J3_GLOPL